MGVGWSYLCAVVVYASGSECAINVSWCWPMFIRTNTESECFLAWIWSLPSKALPNALPAHDLAVKMLSITRIDKAVLLWHAPSGMALQWSQQAFCHSPGPARCTFGITLYKCHSYEGLWCNLGIFHGWKAKSRIVVLRRPGHDHPLYSLQETEWEMEFRSG